MPELLETRALIATSSCGPLAYPFSQAGWLGFLGGHALRYPWVDPSEDSAGFPGGTDSKLSVGLSRLGARHLPQVLQAEGVVSSAMLLCSDCSCG